MESSIKELVNKALKQCFGIEGLTFTVERPKDLSHGDYATNVALVVSKQLGKNPQEVAQIIASWIDNHKTEGIGAVSIAGPGFINFSLARNFFVKKLEDFLDEKYSINKIWEGKQVMVEYTDPNPFKPFHIGHLMTNAIGESIARIIAKSGGKIIRANYQGDVGLHVAKAIWGLEHHTKKPLILKAISKIYLTEDTAARLAQYIGNCYVLGSEKYENDENIKKEIDFINKEVYSKDNELVNNLYDWGREVTLKAFERIYKILGTKFDEYFFESEMSKKGQALVAKFLEKGVFEKSNGAIVFKAEEYNKKLHTRVFITSNNLPTYETKELGLTETKFEKYNLDESIVVTAVEQKDYMAVATEAMRQIHPEYAKKMKHVTHGMMRFANGKMSSRKGNIVTGESLLNDAIRLAYNKGVESIKTKIFTLKSKIEAGDTKHRKWGDVETQIGVAGIKYSILRQAIGGDIIYDPEQALSFDGDSGPYLQYSATRANSVIEKAVSLGIVPSIKVFPERTYGLEKKLYQFSDVLERSATELEPHHIATYLVDIASSFNSFYKNEIIADLLDIHAPYKLALTKAFTQTMTNGLYLLGISVPEKM